MSELTYFKKFSTKNEYDTYINGTPVLPNVSIVTNEDVYYKGENVPPTPPPHDYSQDYLTFNIISGGTIVWKTTSASMAKTISYSIDNGETWSDIVSTTGDGVAINVNAENKILFKGHNNQYGNGGNFSSFSDSTAMFEVEGNIMSMIYSDYFKEQKYLTNTYTFFKLFFQCSGLTSIENLILPATTLQTNCYDSMFQGCTSLTTAPVLPATTLKSRCYGSMFYDCSSLTTAPVLSATTLADSCYDSMFWGCTSLNTAPALPATTLEQNCYRSMFRGCTSLTTAPALPATILGTSCYDNMFNGCTSLTKAPALPATTLARFCYYGMFVGCTSLTTAPSLPAATLTQSCYNYMFRNCTNLKYIKCLATDISASNCTNGWVQGVDSTGIFAKNASMTDWTTGANGIPSGWSVQDAA